MTARTAEPVDKFLTSVSSLNWSLTPWLFLRYSILNAVNLPNWISWRNLLTVQLFWLTFGKRVDLRKRFSGFTSVTRTLTACWSIQGQSLVCWSPSGLYIEWDEDWVGLGAEIISQNEICRQKKGNVHGFASYYTAIFGSLMSESKTSCVSGERWGKGPSERRDAWTTFSMLHTQAAAGQEEHCLIVLPPF